MHIINMYSNSTLISPIYQTTSFSADECNNVAMFYVESDFLWASQSMPNGGPDQKHNVVSLKCHFVLENIKTLMCIYIS